MYSCSMDVQYIHVWFEERIIMYVCGVTPALEAPFVAGPLVFFSFFLSFYFLFFSFSFLSLSSSFFFFLLPFFSFLVRGLFFFLFKVSLIVRR